MKFKLEEKRKACVIALKNIKDAESARGLVKSIDEICRRELRIVSYCKNGLGNSKKTIKSLLQGINSILQKYPRLARCQKWVVAMPLPAVATAMLSPFYGAVFTPLYIILGNVIKFTPMMIALSLHAKEIYGSGN
jgi:hypothetical protein